MNCSELTERLLSESEDDALRAHLASCSGCRERVALARHVPELVRRELRPLSPALRDRVLASVGETPTSARSAPRALSTKLWFLATALVAASVGAAALLSQTAPPPVPQVSPSTPGPAPVVVGRVTPGPRNALDVSVAAVMTGTSPTVDTLTVASVAPLESGELEPILDEAANAVNADVALVRLDSISPATSAERALFALQFNTAPITSAARLALVKNFARALRTEASTRALDKNAEANAPAPAAMAAPDHPAPAAAAK